MRRFCIAIILICVLLTACTDVQNDVSSADPAVSGVGSAVSDVTSTVHKPHEFTGTESFNNLTMRNGEDRMGDGDGPAYCVYSNRGYNGASFDVELSQLELNLSRNDDAGHVNAYIFIGADVYHPEDNYWVNCADAGLCNMGDGWHLFYNLYSVADPDKTLTWYESDKILPSDHDYRLTLDTSSYDGRATLIVYDLTEDKRTDRAGFQLRHAKSDGSNTAFLADFALDYPDDLKKDRSGNDSDDPTEITLYNTDRGIYMKNLRVSGAALLKDGESLDWTAERTQNRGIWPDADITAIDYACTSVRNAISNTEYIVDIDMNRNAG